MAQRLLLVDDKEDNLDSLKLGFSRYPYTVVTAVGGKAALERIQDEPPYDVIVTDLMMPDVGGIEVVKAAKAKSSNTAIMLLTAFGTVETAVQALREGAWHYLTKPVALEELRREVGKAMERSQLVQSNENLKRAVKEKFGFDGIIGSSNALHKVFDRVRQVADTRATVLIQGESGTGKELISKAIHFNSDRAAKPFLPVHCAALTETLLESELFGHEKGSFTGAIGRKQGRFELADGGTLFLDEIGEIPLSIQVKLLRVLETKEFMRVGGIEPVRVDVRVIAATNRNLATEVKEGRFREDLFYRLNVITITLPSLRERREDIPILVNHFLDTISAEHNRPRPVLTPAALDRLVNHGWQGNVRELRNVLESMILFCRDAKIDVGDLPDALRSPGAVTASPAAMVNGAFTLSQMEDQMIRQMLEKTDQNRTKAAKLLGISRRTLQRKLKELGLEQ